MGVSPPRPRLRALRPARARRASLLLPRLRRRVRDDPALGLGRYYAQRILDPALRAPRPEAAERWDLARHVTTRADGTHELSLAVDGLQCGACVWLIESRPRARAERAARPRQHDHAPAAAWSGAVPRTTRTSLVGLIERLGYRLVPFDPASLSAAQDETGPRTAACSRCGRLRRGQRDADVDRHLGRRGGRPAARHGSGDARSAALGVGADRHAGDRLCRAAVLRLGRRRAAAVGAPTWTCRSASASSWSPA